MVIMTRNVDIILREAINHMNCYYSNIQFTSDIDFNTFTLSYDHCDKILSLGVNHYNQNFQLTCWKQFNFEMYEELQAIIRNFNSEELPYNFSAIET